MTPKTTVSPLGNADGPIPGRQPSDLVSVTDRGLSPLTKSIALNVWHVLVRVTVERPVTMAIVLAVLALLLLRGIEIHISDISINIGR
jgi:hypothetical protein